MGHDGYVKKADRLAAMCPACRERENKLSPALPLRNARHEKFCSNIVNGLMTPAESYRASGFSSRNTTQQSRAATGLRNRLDVRNRIIYMQELALKHDQKTREWVDDNLKEIVDRCMQKAPVLDKRGVPIGEWKFDSAGATKALHLMGKDRGMFVDQLEVGVNAELAGKSSKEIEAMVIATALDLGRPFIIRMGEAVGLQFEGVGAGDSGTTTESSKSVPTLQ